MTQPAGVYLVTGCTGSHSDWTTWVVAAYLHRETAEQHLAQLNDFVAMCKPENKHLRPSDPDDPLEPMDAWDTVRYLVDKGNPYDPRMEIRDSDGPEYTIEEVPLPRHLDEFLEWVADGKVGKVVKGGH